MIFFSSIENCLVMHHLLNDQICTMVISCHKLDDQVYGIERVVIYRQSLMRNKEDFSTKYDAKEREVDLKKSAKILSALFLFLMRCEMI